MDEERQEDGDAEGGADVKRGPDTDAVKKDVTDHRETTERAHDVSM